MLKLRRASHHLDESRSWRAHLRQAACIASLALIAGTFPAVTATADPQVTPADQQVLLAEPGPPPKALTDADRIPPLAALDEDGQRNPESVALVLPDELATASPGDETADASAQGIVPVPEQSAPTVDVFAFGDPDAAHAAVVSTVPVNTQAADGTWQDVQLAPEPGQGWTATIPNGSLLFPEKLTSETPVQATFGPFTIGTSPIESDASAVGGIVADDRPGSITYPEVLVATDFVYSATAAGYEEFVVLKDKSASSTVSWTIEAPGLALALGEGGDIVVLDGKDAVSVIPPAVSWDSSLPPRIDKAPYTLTQTGEGRFEMGVALDPAFLAAATYPITIDPGYQYQFAQDNDDTYVDSSTPDTDYRDAWLQVANGGPERRAFVRFDTADLRRDDRIVYEARLDLYVWEATENAPAVDVRRATQAWPDPLTWNTQPSVDPDVLDSASCAFCLGWMSFDVSAAYQHFLQSDIAEPWSDDGLRASTDGATSYLFRSAESVGGPTLSLSWNDLPHAPLLDTPADEYVFEDDTPTLKVQGGQDWPSDPNSDVVLVQFQISDDGQDFTGNHIVWESPWLDSRSYVVPSGILTDGQTYYWRARSWDACYSSPAYQMCSYTDALGAEHERKATGVRSFTVVMKHLGKDERWAMWSHDLGNGMDLNVNESNGNLFLDVPLDSLATPVGDLSIGLSYNSQQEADYGLSPGWDVAIGAAGSLRDLPIDLVKLDDFPDNGVKVRFRGGRTSYFPHRDHHVFATVTAGAGTIRQNADGGFTFVSPGGDRYEFSQAGRLLSANPVATNLASGANAISYVYKEPSSTT